MTNPELLVIVMTLGDSAALQAAPTGRLIRDERSWAVLYAAEP